ncbi:sperm-specific protein Don juan-like [Drosophila guanche]|uniref:sperm-specific protein Don juan-like n=1 Tax=Drosophila guanche TaxID=7266 RepID=UPI00147261FB|nr:sperm-specific protein Don juan-like [Drosophila guanche]
MFRLTTTLKRFSDIFVTAQRAKCNKKEDPCKKKDPCAKKENPCKKKEDSCGKEDDKNKDICGRKKQPMGPKCKGGKK